MDAASDGPTLQATIAAAQPGDTVTVPAGLHRGPFQIALPPGATLAAGAPGATLLGPIVLTSGTLNGLTLQLGATAARPQTSSGQRRAAGQQQQRPSSATAAPPLVDIPSGSPTLLGCQISGGVRVGRGSTAQIRSCHIHSTVELNGTADGCEVSGCTIEALGGAGILARRQACALLASNRVLNSGGAGIEVTARAVCSLVENEILDARGQARLIVCRLRPTARRPPPTAHRPLPPPHRGCWCTARPRPS